MASHLPRFRTAIEPTVVLLLAMFSGACRFLPNHPYWIEALGNAQAIRVAAWSSGALAIGTDSRLYGYPGPWARPWAPQGPPQELRALAAARAVAYAIESDGQVARFTGAQWQPLAGSSSWGTTDLSVGDDERLVVLVGGRPRLFDADSLVDSPCSSQSAVALAVSRADDVYVLDGAGALYRGDPRRCARMDAPTPLRRIAAGPDRLVGVGVDGSVWRLRAGAWQALPAAHKYRPGSTAVETRAKDVALSQTNTWILDDEGSIFLLSDET